MSSDPPGRVPFQAHVELLRHFLARRELIVEQLQGLLNAQHRPGHFLQDRGLLARLFADAFFAPPVSSREQSALRGQLQQAHWAGGFKPRDMPGIPNEMFDPADMMSRAFNLWQQTRWPGRNARVRFGQTLFNLYVVRCLALLVMRAWDDAGASAASRLAQVQAVLDALWSSSPQDQPVLVRDARWLVPVAQSPTTDQLAPYFNVAEQVADALPEPDRLAIHKAAVVMAGGHLRSQLRHFNMQGTPLDDHGLLLRTRRSNALDCAMTVQGLVPLLEAYARAVDRGASQDRVELADAICQGISPDPDLYVNRPQLLAAYSMIEHLFVAIGSDAGAALTPMGRRHTRLVDRYTTLVARLAAPLAQDCQQFRPVRGAYSPYGVMYGFSSNLLEHMTMKALQPGAEARFALEDVFTAGSDGAAKLAWVSGWRRLPHISAEVLKLYEYPQQFAEVIFERVADALRRGATADGAQPASVGRLFVATGDAAKPGAPAAHVPPLPTEYLFSSDPEAAAAQRAVPLEEAVLRGERNEGEYLVSYQTARGWVAISKDVLTDVLGNGRDARICGLPGGAVQTLTLLYPALVAG